ncbi:MAG TPA: hypothetical protein VMY05_09085 [Acidobacteriota bacterium]|nr:hypothetical protein [Acidobacteriota bacterium]
MCQVSAKAILLSAGILIALPVRSHARTDLRLIGGEISERVTTGSPHIFSGSDTLRLNGRLLRPGIDYRFVVGEGYFDLSGLVPGGDDTLQVIYERVPAWLARSYGRPLPRAVPAAQGAPSLSLPRPEKPPAGSFGSRVKLSGAKSFRLSARSAGASEFGQSLDLTLAGELAEGVQVAGSISDRGFDPAYGTANSRLSELDKVNLALTSRRLTAQIGDIAVADPGRGPGGKAISGASFKLTYPRWHVHGTAARPRGTYTSFELTGQDGSQGPYQIGEGSRARPIVPGSESVWLDGRLLERGAGKDYTVDYPTGRITFNANRPIDGRSRIEVDYEPRMTEYKGELLAFGTGGQSEDSTLFFSAEVLREGDDKDQLLSGDLSDTDLALLEAAGDSVAARSGVIPDSTGSYALVNDSLPDSVYQHVGEGEGDFSVTFSFVGRGKGDYRFLGSDNYEYVGPGQGDYLPIVVVPAARRTSRYSTVIGLRPRGLGELRLDLRASRFDRNLWSSRDDNDNDGIYYDLQSYKEWQANGRTSFVKAHRRIRQAEYNARERINRADFRRDFLLPEAFVAASDEALHDVSASVSPWRVLSIGASYADLDYEGEFDSRSGGLGAELIPLDRLRLHGAWRRAVARLAGASLSGDGTLTRFDGGVTVEPSEGSAVSAAYERDVRRNEYSTEPRGTRFNRVRLGLYREQDDVQYEYFAEDSLSTGWSQSLVRNRVSATSNRQMGVLSYDAAVSYQWLRQPDLRGENFLSRLNLRYNNVRRRLILGAGYQVSDERRNARGITYLEVEPGQGNFSREDGQFVPDPDGKYIQVEEILSDDARVRRGDKSFHIDKDWRLILVRFTSNIEEELLEGGQRNLWWVLPFYSDESQPYLYYNRRYNADVRLFPVRAFYALNLQFAQDLEKRDIAGTTRRRRDTRGAVSLKQSLVNTFVEESAEFFENERDAYFTGAGEINGYKLGLSVRQAVGRGEVSGGGTFRRAETSLDETSVQYALTAGFRAVLLSRGELRLSTELYRQNLDNLAGPPSFRLTDNRPGERGALWSLSLRYGVKSGVRVNLSVNGRHADDRTARVVARSEVVASF